MSNEFVHGIYTRGTNVHIYWIIGKAFYGNMKIFTEGKVVDSSEDGHGYMVISLISGEGDLDKVSEAGSVLASGNMFITFVPLTCILEMSWLTTFIFMNFVTALSPLLPWKCHFVYCHALYVTSWNDLSLSIIK